MRRETLESYDQALASRAGLVTATAAAKMFDRTATEHFYKMLENLGVMRIPIGMKDYFNLAELEAIRNSVPPNRLRTSTATTPGGKLERVVNDMAKLQERIELLESCNDDLNKKMQALEHRIDLMFTTPKPYRSNATTNIK